MRSLAMSSVLGLVFFSCSNLEKKIEREPSSRGNISSPCRDSRDCDLQLACRKGWCQPPGLPAEAYEKCVRDNGCRSRRCETGYCVPSQSVPADNGEKCFMSIPTNCRSQSVDSSGRCKGSWRFPSFPGASCDVGTDCISGNCDTLTKRCEFGSDYLSCAWVGEAAATESQCCSRFLSQNICRGRRTESCRQGACGPDVGRVCAADGQRVKYSTECCSGVEYSGVCVPAGRQRFCQKTSDCPDGLVCDPRSMACRAP